MGARQAVRKTLEVRDWPGYDMHGADELLEDQAEDSHSPENGWSLESLHEEIRGRLAELHEEVAAASERFQLRLDARRLALQMPPVNELELYMRYETILEYQMQRNLELPANVQRMRLLGLVGYRPVKALAAEQAGGSNGDSEGHRKLRGRFCETKPKPNGKP